VVKPRCPDPELLALFAENRLRRTTRSRILRHAADCVACRRQLAIASLSPAGPVRARIADHLSSGRLSVVAGLIFGAVALWFLGSGSDPEPAPRIVRAAPRPAAPASPVVRSFGEPSAPAEPPRRRAVDPPTIRSDVDSGDWVTLGPASNESVPIPVSERQPDPVLAGQPRRRDSVAQGSAPPPLELKPAEAEAMGRLAILDPFGGLVLEGASGRTSVQGSRVVPVEARLTAVGRPSGFRLGDGLRVQLAPGSSVSVFQNLGRRCLGLAVLQGALLVEATQPQSLYLRRDGAAGLLEGLSGAVYLNAGPRPDSLTVTPLGTSALVWKRVGQAAVEVAAGDTLGVDSNGQEVAAHGSKPKPSIAKFAAWPEPTSLFYSSFENDAEGMERPGVVQGTPKEGYVSAVVAGKGRKAIEVTLPPSVQNLPSDAVVHLRVRTTAVRIQFGVGREASRTVPVSVAMRNRSETGWTSLTVSMAALDQDGHRGRREGGKPGGRGSLTFTAEAPSKVSAEELVFDIDEIEISRT